VSEQNVELMRRLAEAFNARDIEAYIALCDPSVEPHSTFTELGAVYHGHDGVRKWHRDLQDAWGDQIRLEIEALFDLGEQTLGFTVWHGRGRQSGVEVALTAAQLARWRDGALIYIKGYADRKDALSDLGVSEEALEPFAP
jgi:ketosteroid isomerase-like protein